MIPEAVILANINLYQIPLRCSPGAYAKVSGSPDYPSIRGTVRFYQTELGVIVTASVKGLPYGNHPCPVDIFGFHIHEGDLCTGTAEDPFSNAGSHFNPENCPHPAHAGDLPPLFGNHGFAFMTVLTDRFAVKDIIGRTVIIHSSVDDFTTQPAGNSGTKMACGQILRSSCK